MNQIESKLRSELFSSAKNIVVKVGSRILTRNGRVDDDRIRSLVGQLAELSDQNRSVSLVSSGAVGTAMTLLNTDRPTGLGTLQAYAAIGQAELIHRYNVEFERYDKRAAQVLLTIEDMNDRQRYLNLRNTIFSLFELDAIPIINENDCVATEEISVTFGDNDRLAANVAMLVDADLLVVLSDVDGLYDQNPAEKNAKRLGFVDSVDSTILDYATEQIQHRTFSKGGMVTKIAAAEMATSVGIPTIIAGGREDNVLSRILDGQSVGTYFNAASQTTNSRKRWIKSSIESNGLLIVDSGAVAAIKQNGKSLLPIGVTEVCGQFEAGNLISVADSSRQIVAKGISNFDSRDSAKIIGLQSNQVSETLNRVANEEMIHRDNLVIL